MSMLLVFMFGWTINNLAALLVGVRQVQRNRGANENDSKNVDLSDFPFFSLIVPMKEEGQIAERILNSLTKIDYPSDKYETIIVDDSSLDVTSDICKKFESLYPDRIRYFHRGIPSGKPSALNYGLKFAKGEIVGVFDADNIPDPDVLIKTAKHFEEGEVAAVQGLLSSLNAEENMLTKIIHLEDKVYRHVLMLGKDKLGLFVPLAGTCQFVKREVLEEVGGWAEEVLAEDMELSARLNRKGHRIKFSSNIQSRQENPSKFGQLIGQRLRWFRGWMQLAFRYGSLLKRLDRRSLDAEAFFVGPFMMVVVLVTYVLSLYKILFSFNFGTITSVLAQLTSLSTLLTLFIIGIGLAYVTKPRKISNVKWLPFMYLYWTTQVFVAFYALLQIVFRRPLKWTKTPRTGRVTDQEIQSMAYYHNSNGRGHLGGTVPRDWRENKLRVGFVSTFPPSRCGVADYSAKVVRALDKKAYMIVFADNPKRSDISKRIFRIWKRGSLSYPYKLFIHILRKNVDVIHIQHEYLLYGNPYRSGLFPLLPFLLRLFGKEVVITMHSVVPISSLTPAFFEKYGIGREFAMVKRLFTIAVTKLVGLFSSRLVVHNEASKRVLIGDYRFKTEKVVVIPHGVELLDLKLTQEEAKHQLNIEDSNICLFFGFVKPGKGLEYVIKALPEVLRSYPNTKLIIAGGEHPHLNGWANSYFEQLQDLVAKLKITGAIMFSRGFVPVETATAYLTAADVCVMPYDQSEIISASGVLQMFASHGKPLVASEGYQTSELTNGENAILVSKGNSDEIAKAIILLLSDRILRTKLSENLRAMSKRNNWENVAIRMLELYTQLDS